MISKKILGTQKLMEKTRKNIKKKKKIKKSTYVRKFKLTVKLAKRTGEKKNFQMLGFFKKFWTFIIVLQATQWL